MANKKGYTYITAIVVYALVGFIMVFAVWWYEDHQTVSNNNTGVISNFEECVAAGNPVMESYPRQCAAGGVSYVEDITKDIPCSERATSLDPIDGQVACEADDLCILQKGSGSPECPTCLNYWEKCIDNPDISDSKNAEICETGTEYENTALDPVTCECPSGYEFRTLKNYYTACPEDRMSDCVAATITCWPKPNPPPEDENITTNNIDWLTYENEEWGITFNYPPTSEIFEKNSFIEVRGLQENGLYPRWFITHGSNDFYNPPEGTAVSEWVDGVNMYDGLGEPYKIDEKETVHVIDINNVQSADTDLYYVINNNWLFQIQVRHKGLEEIQDVDIRFLESISFE